MSCGEAGAAAVVAVDRGGRVVAGDDHRPLARFACRREPLQLRLQEGELRVTGQRRILAALRR